MKSIENTGVFEYKHIEHKKEIIVWEFPSLLCSSFVV